MAYAFLTAEDIRVSLRDLFLSEITDDDIVIAEKAELQCIDLVRSYLSGRYDVDALFAATGADRKPLLVERVTNLFVYRIYKRINPRKMSEDVKLSYDETLEWLNGVARGKFNPDFPAVQGPDIPTNDLLMGGSDPMKGHYY
jgi:phage gp36-like protein